MRSQFSIIVCFTVLTLLIASHDAKVFTIQTNFQRNRDNHPIWDLSNASNGKALILQPEKMLSFNFCLRQRSQVSIQDIRFSNGNISETVVIEIDGTPVGTFQTPTTPDWNQFRSTGILTADSSLPIGWHYVTIMYNGTADGLAVDKIDLNIEDEQLVHAIFTCELSCLPDQRFRLRPNDVITGISYMAQESYNTSCAEVDNVNIPIFNTNVQEYEITAVLPSYTAFSNWRFENNTGCPHLSPVYWRFYNIILSKGVQQTLRSDRAIMYVAEGRDSHSKISVLLILQFRLEGKSKGMVDSEMGTTFRISFTEINSPIRVGMSYAGRREVTSPDVKWITRERREAEWNTTDFSWSDSKYNMIFLEIDSNTSTQIFVQYLHLERRTWLADQIRTIYKGDNIIVEAVFSDFWWLYPDAMAIHLSNGETYYNTSYFRVYRPIPWSSGYAQVFVLYHDGNARLLPVPPEGSDWIPFGSSVIIGQTDPTAVRPYTPIQDVRIDLNRFIFDLQYKDGSTSKLTLKCTLSETRVIVSDIRFRGNPLYFPFTTFRSMYISEGNSDVDHVSVNGLSPMPIMNEFGSVQGRSFVFHRKCMSRHLNLSPDIYIDIRRTTNDFNTAQLLQSSAFQELLERIQSHRRRLWIPRTRVFG